MLCTATNIFLVVSMTWFSYTDKLYIKMMAYLWELDWNLHHQHFIFNIYRKQLKRHGCTWNLFWSLAQPTSEPNCSEQLASSCWRSTVWTLLYNQKNQSFSAIYADNCHHSRHHRHWYWFLFMSKYHFSHFISITMGKLKIH